jgi:hypothetical protein
MAHHALVRRCHIIGTVGHELPDAVVDLIQQRLDLRRIAGIQIFERVRHDRTPVGFHRQMQLAAATLGLHAVFLLKPLTRAKHFHAGAVDQHAQRAHGRICSYPYPRSNAVPREKPNV